MPSTTRKKSLYTPVFFSSSEPPRSSKSTNGADPKVSSAYLNSLSRTHIALAQIVQEAPLSRPGSPTEDADGSYPDQSTQERVSALRARVREAWAMADGNPADGKWTLLTQLLCMGVTSGRAGRWAGTRTDLESPDAPDGGWINASTEAEWAEWEKEVGLKDKVQNWKMRLETHEELASQIIKDTQQTTTVESSSNQEEARPAVTNTDGQVASVAIPTSATPKTAPLVAAESKLKLKAASQSAITTNLDPLKDKSLFGFAVKRSNVSAAAVGKKPHVDPKSANGQPIDAAAGDAAQPVRKIADIPEMSFLPPSFPSSQMITSTPNAKPTSSDKHKHKPTPIPFTASPIDHVSISPPMSSPRVTKVYGRSTQSQVLEKSTSLPAIPSTAVAAVLLPLPPVHTTPTRNRDDTTNNHNKRLSDSANGDVEHDRALKKARTMPSLESSPIAAGFPPPSAKDGANPPLPTTPKRQNLPTLTELLASAKKGKQKIHSPKSLKPKSAVSASIESVTKSKFFFPSPLPHSPSPAVLEDNPFMLDPYAISVNHSALELDIDPDSSPSKSLSSLAGSDSEDEDDEPKYQAPEFNFSSFHPYATSTQHQNHAHEGHKGHSSPFLSENGRTTAGGGGAALSLGFGGYNSQFDVAAQVDKVDKLLEKDVDFEGWLRDPSLEREDVLPVEESP